MCHRLYLFSPNFLTVYIPNTPLGFDIHSAHTPCGSILHDSPLLPGRIDPASGVHVRHSAPINLKPVDASLVPITTSDIYKAHLTREERLIRAGSRAPSHPPPRLQVGDACSNAWDPQINIALTSRSLLMS